MKVDHSHSIAEMDKLIKDMGETLRGDIVKTGSRIIYRLRGEVESLREANRELAQALDAAHGMEAIDPMVRAHLGEAAGLVKHQMGKVLNTPCDSPAAMEAQAVSLKRLSEAMSFLARGVVWPDIHVQGVEDVHPELDIKMKPTPRERCPVCSGLTQGGRADVGNLCECSYCDQCDAPYEDKWTDDNGNALCPKCRDAQAAGTVWKCDGCGALFNDQGLDPGLALVTVSGMWTRENGKWTHYCPEPNRRVSEVTKVTDESTR